MSGAAAETIAQQAPALAQRRGGRRVQPNAPVTPPAPGGIGGIGRIVGGIVSALTNVPFSVEFLPAPGAKLPKGERRLRIVDATGRTVLSLTTQGNSIKGTRPASDKPVTFEVEIRNENPAFSLTTQRRMVAPQEAGAKEILQVRPVVAKRKLLIGSETALVVLQAGRAQLLALAGVQVFASELPRLAVVPKAELGIDVVFVVFSVFETCLLQCQLLV